MANEEHLQKLKEGVSRWNTWRQEQEQKHPENTLNQTTQHWHTGRC